MTRFSAFFWRQLMNQKWSHGFRMLSALALFALAGCRPGYIKASDLESKGQGPSACAKSCEELGMRMAALVLVGDTLPGCVCQPVTVQSPTPKVDAPAVPPAVPSAAPSTTPPPPPAAEGAAAATIGYVVIAAAIAAQQSQDAQKRQASPVNY
jgi:hypothetical protein